MKERENQWPVAGQELWIRFLNALKSIKFLFYFFGAILVLSGAGIWLPFILESSEKASQSYVQNVFTYSIAILGILYMESLNSNNDENSILKTPAQVFGLISIILLLLGTFVEKLSGYNLAPYGMLIALMLYFLAYANNEAFDEKGNAMNSGYRTASEDMLPNGEEGK